MDFFGVYFNFARTVGGNDVSHYRGGVFHFIRILKPLRLGEVFTDAAFLTTEAMCLPDGQDNDLVRDLCPNGFINL